MMKEEKTTGTGNQAETLMRSGAAAEDSFRNDPMGFTVQPCKEDADWDLVSMEVPEDDAAQAAIQESGTSDQEEDEDWEILELEISEEEEIQS